jgi:hypothetical protein
MANTIQHIIATPVPVIWANVVTPKPANDKLGIPSRYEVTFVFNETDPEFLALKAAFSTALQGVKAEGRKVPIDRGDALADKAAAKDRDRECLRGKFLVKAHLPLLSRKKEPLLPPRLYVVQDGKYVQHTDRAANVPFFYNGVLVKGEVTVIPFEGMGGGVSLWINELVSLNQGERLNVGAGDPAAKYGSAMTEYVGKLSDVKPGEDLEY